MRSPRVASAKTRDQRPETRDQGLQITGPTRPGLNPWLQATISQRRNGSTACAADNDNSTKIYIHIYILNKNRVFILKKILVVVRLDPVVRANYVRSWFFVFHLIRNGRVVAVRHCPIECVCAMFPNYTRYQDVAVVVCKEIIEYNDLLTF